jgi:hypothetical protein
MGKGTTIKRETSEKSKPRVENEDELQERIRLRAYELYEGRGRRDGLELDDWVQAEEEVLNSGSRAA